MTEAGPDSVNQGSDERNAIVAAIATLGGPFAAAGAHLVKTLTAYNGGKLRADALAGLTVAMVAIPQSMAFAQIAGVPPIYGLYTAIVGAIVGALLTSSSHLAIGPTNTMSLLVYAVVGTMAAATVEDKVATAVLLTLMAGSMQLIFAVARMGDLVRYVSHSVIVGFSAGAGVLIAVGQVPAFLGISLTGIESHWHGVLEKVDRFVQATDSPDWQPIVVGVISLATIIACRKISRMLPAYLIAVIVGGAVVWGMGWTPDQLRLVGDLPRGLPPFTPPAFDWARMQELFAPGIAIALVGIIEAYGIGKTIAGKASVGKDPERIDANQEFVCQAATNVVGSFFQCIPSTGSFSRTALNFKAGAQTQFAGVFVGVFVAIVFALLAPFARYIPMASIAAILFIVALGLVDWPHFRKLCKSNKADATVVLGTFIATIAIPLDYAVFVGVFLNIALYLRRARQLYITEMLEHADSPSGFIERPLREDTGDRKVIFLQVEGNLFFAAADDLQDRLNALVRSPAEVVILRLKRTHMVDATVMEVIEQFAEQMHAKNGHVLLAGVRPRMIERMAAFGIVHAIGKENIFAAQPDHPFQATKAAVTRAKELTAAAE